MLETIDKFRKGVVSAEQSVPSDSGSMREHASVEEVVDIQGTKKGTNLEDSALQKDG